MPSGLDMGLSPNFSHVHLKSQHTTNTSDDTDHHDRKGRCEMKLRPLSMRPSQYSCKDIQPLGNTPATVPVKMADSLHPLPGNL